MTDYKKYENYKKTNIDWLDEIPSNWDMLPNRAIFKERITRNCDNEELLSVTIKNGVIRQAQLLKNSSKKDSSNEDKSKYKLVKINDIAYNKMRMWQGALGVSDYQGIVSPAYVILNPRANINSKYYHYLYRSPKYVRYSYNYSYGICDDQLSLRYKDFSKMYSIVPPIDEQDKIVSFIEYKEKQINKLIKKQKKLIELLEEKKKIIITEAVTKGLDKSVPMKDSGIDYIGQIPQNWEIKKIKQILKQISKKKIYRGGIYIGMENIESWTGRFNVVLNANIEGTSNVFSKGQILFGKLRPYLAKCIITDCAGLCSSELLVLKPNKDQDENFIQKLMLSKTFIDLVDASTYGAKMPRANWGFIKNIECAIPDINEQREIIKYINKIDEFINKSIQNKKILIEKLEEYKKNLISYAVTGQIDVRDYEIPKIDDDVDLEEIKNISEDDTETISEVEYANN